MTLLEVLWLWLFALFALTRMESEGVIFNLAPGGNRGVIYETSGVLSSGVKWLCECVGVPPQHPPSFNMAAVSDTFCYQAT